MLNNCQLVRLYLVWGPAPDYVYTYVDLHLQFSSTRCSFSVLLADKTSFAPRPARQYANSSPMPEDAPVIQTTLPLRRSRLFIQRAKKASVRSQSDSSISIREATKQSRRNCGNNWNTTHIHVDNMLAYNVVGALLLNLGGVYVAYVTTPQEHGDGGK